MRRTFCIPLRLVFLFFYALYAVTPVSLYAVAGRALEHSVSLRQSKHSSEDIVWENVLFSLLADDDDDDSDVPSVETPSSVSGPQDDGMVLVRKKRALLRRQPDLRPGSEVQVLSYSCVQQTPGPYTAYQAAQSPLVREIDGCFVLNSGLSPPFLLS